MTALRITVLAMALGGMLVLAACQRADQDGGGKSPAPAAAAAEGISLTAEQVAKMGITTAPAAAADDTPETTGYGMIVPHDAVAVAVAELMTAEAAQTQSRATLSRTRHLAGTPGALPADALDSATRQVASDAAALALAQRRLSAVIGAAPPKMMQDSALLQELASGKVKLLRVTFPLGASLPQTPASLHVLPLDAAAAWVARPVWSAPADASLPGRSFFSLLRNTDAAEGERLLVRAPGAGPPQHGVRVPASALVISGGKYWCYVESKPDVFERREVATDRPLGGDFLVTQGLAVGERIVTSEAGLLLAREMNPSTEAD